MECEIGSQTARRKQHGGRQVTLMWRWLEQARTKTKTGITVSRKATGRQTPKRGRRCRIWRCGGGREGAPSKPWQLESDPFSSAHSRVMEGVVGLLESDKKTDAEVS
ncbi:hypothetical protein NDU88_003933 [Pleurodeles waltl]|uniref:Uncharacterized protein n=1 Tax=Pleurodeles waltl TaxID=8319 RepID=A0AAV7LIG5_PLEWA|nr:hypothetical protein NDU88_003933 [Pleurodeles waltl]